MNLKWSDNFTYYFYDKEKKLIAARLAEVPAEVDDFADIRDAIGYVNKLGCIGWSQHKIRNEYHQLCLDVLKIAVKKYGEIIPIVFRGIRSTREEKDSLILFGSTDRRVAEFYADLELREYKDVFGLRVFSQAVSVVSGDWNLQDEEIIFFP